MSINGESDRPVAAAEPTTAHVPNGGSTKADDPVHEQHHEDTAAGPKPQPDHSANGQPDGHGTSTNGNPTNGNRKNEDDPKADGVQHQSSSGLKDMVTETKGKIKDKAKGGPAGGFDTTPLPDVPPGYTVKLTFHSASNLPCADIHNAAADPYLMATLTAAVPKRHKEDPVLSHRTQTIRSTTEPKWNDEWIVANVPSSGFRVKIRLYDEDYPDHDDRLGNVTYSVDHIDEQWAGLDHAEFPVKKHMGSKRAYFFKAASTLLEKNASMTPRFVMSATVLGRSDPPGAQMYTVGPNIWIKHFSPMIGRLTGIKVNKDEQKDGIGPDSHEEQHTKKYDFQANEVQLQGPVPPKLYHRYVEFRPMIGRMFSSHGLRGRILNKALRHQHARIYNFDSTTQWGSFKPCSEEASLQFLKLAHFDEGGRMFTYVLTLDGVLRFTETGKEFGIDLLSKHTMHSDVSLYIACSGEFFIRRLKKPTSDESPEPPQPTHPTEPLPGGPPEEPPPKNPSYYQLVIDNDSGTYRPDKSILPDLQEFLERNFPGLGVVTMDCGDKELEKLKANQRKAKKNEGPTLNMVLNRSPSSSSFSSDDESRLGDLERNGEGDDVDPNDLTKKSKKEMVWEVLADPQARFQELKGGSLAHHQKASGHGEASSSKPDAQAVS